MRTEIGTKINCPASWDAMTGSDTVRHCGDCRKNVYNLSAMTEDEANALIASAEEACIRFYYRPDGTVVTSRCQPPKRGSRTAALGVAAGLTAFASIAAIVDHAAPLAIEGTQVRLAMGTMRLKIHVPANRLSSAHSSTIPVSDAPPPSLTAPAATPTTISTTTITHSDVTTMILTAFAIALALGLGLRWPRAADR